MFSFIWSCYAGFQSSCVGGHEWDPLLFHIVVNTWCCHCSTFWPFWHLNVLICISVMTDNVLSWGSCTGVLPIFQVGCSFSFHWVKEFFYVFGQRSPSDISLQIFSYSFWLAFIVAWKCLWQSRVLGLMKSSFSVIYFIDCTYVQSLKMYLNVSFKKSLQYPRSYRCSLVSRSCMISHLTFTSWLHF